MTRTYDNAEELFRFASTRAPERPAQPPAVLALADESEVPAWLATAHEQDFARELVALEAGWQGLDGTAGTAAADALRKSLWKFHVQGIGSGAVQPQQLQRAHQLLAQVSAPAGAPGAAARVAVKLPAALEQHLQARRAAAGDAPALADTGPTRAELEARVLLLQSLAERLAEALAHPPLFEPPLPFSVPVPSRADPEAQRTYFFQPAADPAELFREANESLFVEIEAAEIVVAGRTPWQVLDALRRAAASVLVQIAQLPGDTPVPEIPAGSSFGIRPVGVADLRVVRQVLVGYEKGELAEIQSLAPGAKVERQHSRLQRADEGTSDWSQRDSERWQERSTYEYSDMGKYAYRSARQNQDENASVNFSGTYGEIQFNASTYMNGNRGRDETRGDDLRRARQLVENALQLTREYVGQSRWRVLTAETRDSTLYKQKAKCASAINQYRWVDKVYEAQVFNYGARAMYEIMVPAPAALFTRLLAQQPGRTPFAGPAPARPDVQVSDITESSWALLAERYGVALSAPPPVAVIEYAQVSSPLDIPGHPLTRGGIFARPVALEGYEASIAGVSMSWIGVAGHSGITASVGKLLFSSSLEAGEAIPAQSLGGETGEVTYSAGAWGTVDQYTVNFYVIWTRTARALEQWQLENYQLIVQEYERRLAAHLEKAAVVLTAAQMRAIERGELKRAVLEIIRRGTGISTPAPDAVVKGLPAIDVARLDAAAREVRFFEYAFEWDQMTYRFYPYFWASQESWSAGSFTQQGDGVFTAFLNAGFASVIVPVRKGFEDAVAVYLKTGVVLDIAVVPADDELADMNCEVAQINAHCEDGGVPEGEPWTYRVPTTMTVLDDDAGCELPAIAR